MYIGGWMDRLVGRGTDIYVDGWIHLFILYDMLKCNIMSPCLDCDHGTVPHHRSLLPGQL